MSAPRAGCRDIVQVSDEALRYAGRRMVVISGVAGIGSQFIDAYDEADPTSRGGLRHDQVTVDGHLHPTARMAY